MEARPVDKGAGLGGLFAILSISRPDGYGWAGAILMATGAVSVPALQFRAMWNRTQFWAAAALLAVAQIPLVMAVHGLVDQSRAPFLLAFGVADGLCVIAVIVYTCAPTKKRIP
jgi:anti-sigma-K factor RskA